MESGERKAKEKLRVSEVKSFESKYADCRFIQLLWFEVPVLFSCNTYCQKSIKRIKSADVIVFKISALKRP